MSGFREALDQGRKRKESVEVQKERDQRTRARGRLAIRRQLEDIGVEGLLGK